MPEEVSLPKLERLAREIETMQDPELASLVLHARDNMYDRDTLIQELIDAHLRFFAKKLKDGYYDENPV